MSSMWHLAKPRPANLVQGGKDKSCKCGGLHKKKNFPIHHRPQLPTLIPTNHVPITMYMGMMSIIASHFTQNYSRANHKTPMLIRAKVLGRARMGKMMSTRGQTPS
jgi:hypothetical protein